MSRPFLTAGVVLKKSTLFILIAILLIPTFAQEQDRRAFDGKSWWEHVKVLAADNMEGRDTGSSGLKKAEAYVVDQLKRAGLQAAGTKGLLPTSEVRIAGVSGKRLQCCSGSRRQV